ncbi:MAG: response regulator [Colwellia sp.]|nr:response regulator [Colwellia sp.]
MPNFNARVLVVEDNAVNQKVAQGLLSKFSAEVELELAANGEEALTTLANLPFELVFMDCQMPIMDDYEASGQIRAKTSKVLDRDIPIIAMTANTMKGD